MQPSVREALAARLTALADDELVLAHRDSEWTGHAPILEEGIALANIAQDELGHAGLWYGLRRELDGADPDELVFFREAAGYLNAPLLELPKGDWAFTMLRQYLFDAYEQELLALLQTSGYRPLAEAAAKMRGEERFHLRHTGLWVLRLGQGTPESRGRMERVLETLWPYAQGLFEPLPGDALLAAEGMVPEMAELKRAWLAVVAPHLEDAGLALPKAGAQAPGRGGHGEHLAEMLREMQEVARLEPGAAW